VKRYSPNYNLLQTQESYSGIRVIKSYAERNVPFEQNSEAYRESALNKKVAIYFPSIGLLIE
jgi:hypothetical protein